MLLSCDMRGDTVKGRENMAKGLGRKVSGITFSRAEIVKAVTANRPPSNFWGIDQVVNSVDDKKNNGRLTVRKPRRDDMKMTGTVLKKPAE